MNNHKLKSKGFPKFYKFQDNHRYQNNKNSQKTKNISLIDRYPKQRRSNHRIKRN